MRRNFLCTNALLDRYEIPPKKVKVHLILICEDSELLKEAMGVKIVDYYEAACNVKKKKMCVWIFTVRNKVAKVMFLHLSVILFTGGVCLSACWDTTPPDQVPPPKADGYCCGRYASYWNAFLFRGGFRPYVLTILTSSLEQCKRFLQLSLPLICIGKCLSVSHNVLVIENRISSVKGSHSLAKQNLLHSK